MIYIVISISILLIIFCFYKSKSLSQSLCLRMAELTIWTYYGSNKAMINAALEMEKIKIYPKTTEKYAKKLCNRKAVVKNIMYVASKNELYIDEDYIQEQVDFVAKNINKLSELAEKIYNEDK